MRSCQACGFWKATPTFLNPLDLNDMRIAEWLCYLCRHWSARILG